MEESPATKAAIHRALADFYRRQARAQPAGPLLDRHPHAVNFPILPPYLGEFGFEVRIFLGTVEPWLRNGWMIPARRPELYPPGTAFADAEFFGRIDQLKRELGGTEVLFNLFFGSSPSPWAFAKRDHQGHLTIESPDDAFYRRIAIIERSIRRLVKMRYFHPLRLQTPWDYPLTAVHVPWAPSMPFPMSTLVPSYKPAGFSVDLPAIKPHVGVQLRNMPAKPERNSDSGRILPLVRAAAAHLDIPIICYGHPDGTVAVPGIPSTFGLAGNTPLLEFELGALAKCYLLFAPETGIANLAGWLQVPTLLESQQLGYEYESLRPFNPRIDIIDASMSIEDQVDNLLADEVRVPAPENARNPVSFLHPGLGMPAAFRGEFDD